MPLTEMKQEKQHHDDTIRNRGSLHTGGTNRRLRGRLHARAAGRMADGAGGGELPGYTAKIGGGSKGR